MGGNMRIKSADDRHSCLLPSAQPAAERRGMYQQAGGDLLLSWVPREARLLPLARRGWHGSLQACWLTAALVLSAVPAPMPTGERASASIAWSHSGAVVAGQCDAVAADGSVKLVYQKQATLRQWSGKRCTLECPACVEVWPQVWQGARVRVRPASRVGATPRESLS